MGLSSGMATIVIFVALIFFSERAWLRVVSGICVLSILALGVVDGVRNDNLVRLLLFPALTLVLVVVAYNIQKNWKNWP